MSTTPSEHPLTRRAWVVLTVLLGLEAVAGVVSVIPLGIGFFGAADDDVNQRVSVLISGVVAIIWVAVTFTGALRSRASWVRGSAMTLHVLMFAAGTTVLQYPVLGTRAVAWALIVAAFIGFFGAMLARPTVADVSADTGADTGADDSEM